MAEERPPEKTDASSGLASAALWGAAASAATTLLTLARSKVTAVELGPEGVGVAAQILQFATLAVTPVTAVLLGPGFVRRIAVGTARDAQADASTAWTLSIIGSASLCALVFVTAPWLIPNTVNERLLLGTALLAATAGAGTQFAVQMVSARLQFRRANLANLATMTVLAAGVIIGTLAGGLSGQFVGLALAAVAGLPIAWAISGQRVPAFRWRFTATDKAFLVEAAQLGIAALAGSLFIQAGVIAVRLRLSNTSGDHDVGQFQAAWTIGQTYFLIVLSALGSYVFPRFAQAKAGEELRREVEGAARFVLAQALPVILIVVAIREPLLTLAFSSRFNGASDVLGVQLAGDSAKALAWVFSGCILYRGTAGRVIAVELIGASLLVGSFLVLHPRLGLAATGYAQVITYLLYLPVTAVAFARLTGERPPLRWMAAAIGGVALVLAANELTRRVPLAAWAVLAVGVAGFARSPAVARLRERLTTTRQ